MFRNAMAPFFFAMLCTAPALAQEPGPPTEPSEAPPNPELRPVEALDLEALLNTPVVTASGGHEERRALAAANVVVFTREEIAAHGWRSLADILANVPGLYVIDDLVSPSVGVRGVTGGLRAGTRIIRVMINGAQVNFRPDLTAFLGPEYIPIDVVDRVEIAKGPLSALYGANAFLATVNVITVRPRQTRSEVVGRSTVFDGREGYGLSASAQVESSSASLVAGLTADSLNRSGLSIDKTFAEQDPQFRTYEPLFADRSRGDRAEPMSAFASIGAEWPAVGKLTLQGGRQVLDADGEFQLNSVLTHRTRSAIENNWATARFERSWGESLSTAATIGWSEGAPTRDEQLYLTGTNASYFKTNVGYQALDFALTAKGSPWTALGFDAGVDYTLEDHDVLYYTEILNARQGTRQPGDAINKISAGDRTEVTIANTGAFLQLTAKPIDHLHVSGNVRLDWPNQFDTQYSWRAAAAYEWNDWLVSKIVLGRAFQTPSAVLLYGLSGFGNENNVIGNRTRPSEPKLEPQVVQSLEIVLALGPLGNFTVETSGYWQQVDKKIEFVQLGNNFLARNLGRQGTVGGDLTARFVLRPFFASLSGAYQWNLVEDELTQKLVLDSDPPSSFPNLLVIGDLGVEAAALHLRASLNVRYVGARGASQSNVLNNNEVFYTLDPYTRVDVTLASVGWHALGDAAETQFVARVRNILDQRYSEPGFGGFDVPMLGRLVIIEARQAF